MKKLLQLASWVCLAMMVVAVLWTETFADLALVVGFATVFIYLRLEQACERIVDAVSGGASDKPSAGAEAGQAP